MALNGQDYDDWIVCAADEIVYCTARQTEPKSTQSGVSDQPTNGRQPMDCWAAHLTQQSKLPDLAQFQPLRCDNSCPGSFRNPNRKDNLGGRSKVFAFITLVQGLTSLVAIFWLTDKGCDEQRLITRTWRVSEVGDPGKR